MQNKSFETFIILPFRCILVVVIIIIIIIIIVTIIIMSSSTYIWFVLFCMGVHLFCGDTVHSLTIVFSNQWTSGGEC